MRPSFKVALLLFSLLLSEQIQGIRLDKNYYMSVGQHKSIHVEENTSTKTNNINGVPQEPVVCKLDGDCNSGTKRKRVSRGSKKSQHWLPSIQEDYYGPRGHRSRHH